MGRDEEGTHQRAQTYRKEVVEPFVAARRGRVVKLTGDGALCEFQSVIDAVGCARDIQRTMGERVTEEPEIDPIRLRIGVNVGDLIFDPDGDIYGDGVNIAARIEALADPGGICVSGPAYDQLRGKLDCEFVYLGERALKNIERPVRLYRVIGSGVKVADVPSTTVLPDRPSLAVLPFVNLSGSSEDNYFADGITEDIITSLSKWRWFFVIARNSTFVFKGKAVDVRQLGRDLAVQYVLEGVLGDLAAASRYRSADQRDDRQPRLGGAF
jgi:adenylate cyclase